MRSAAFFVWGLLLGACGGSSQHPPVAPSASLSHSNAAEDLRSKTVALVQRDEDEEVRAFCSGVWVSQFSILTAAHCVDDLAVGSKVEYVSPFDVFNPGSLEAKAEIVPRGAVIRALDDKHDLALLVTSQYPVHGWSRPALNVRAGDFAQSMGQPLGLWWSYSSGDVAAIRQFDAGVNIVWVQATTPISPGNSGGGLFDEDGQLIGIAHGSFTRGQLLNLFVHPQYIHDFLVRNDA